MAKPEDGLGALIVATPAEDGGDDDMGDEKSMAGEALAKALASKDGARIADAFSHMMAVCDEDEGDEADELELDD
jgi:hypothetical protein